MAIHGEKLNRAIDERAVPRCSSCLANDWARPDNVSSVMLIALDAENKPIAEWGIQAIPMICLNCGYVRLHARQVLQDIASD